MTIHAKVTAAQAIAALDHGLAMGTPVLSLDGMMPVEYLHPGDRVITRSGGVASCSRLSDAWCKTPASCGFRMAFWASIVPPSDMIVTPDQPILIRDWRAKALTGAAVALIPAAYLVDGEYIRAEVMAELRLYTLRFERRCGDLCRRSGIGLHRRARRRLKSEFARIPSRFSRENRLRPAFR